MSPLFVRALAIFLISASVFCFSLGETDNYDYGDVVLANILYRHGDRSPIELYPNDPYNDIRKYWPNGLGELSPTGVKQHYELGEYIRNRYVLLLPWKYNSSDIYVRSSNTDRCLMSAQSNLLRLYPPVTNDDNEPSLYQAIPIHTTPMEHDHLFFLNKNCPLYWKDTLLIMKSEELLCIQNLTLGVKQNVTKYSGYKQFQPIIYDTLYIENLYGLKIPEWTRPFYPEPLNSIYLFEQFLLLASTKQLQQFTAGPLITEMVMNMVQKVNGTLDPDRKLFVYSAHDSTISNLLMALGVHNGILTPYASAVFVELRRKDSKNYVLVSYRNTTDHDPYVLKLPQCEIMCPLEDFVKLTKFLKVDFHSKCRSTPKPGELVEAHIPVHGTHRDWKKCFKRLTSDKQFYVILYNRPKEISNNDSSVYVM